MNVQNVKILIQTYRVFAVRYSLFAIFAEDFLKASEQSIANNEQFRFSLSTLDLHRK